MFRLIWRLFCALGAGKPLMLAVEEKHYDMKTVVLGGFDLGLLGSLLSRRYPRSQLFIVLDEEKPGRTHISARDLEDAAVSWVKRYYPGRQEQKCLSVQHHRNSAYHKEILVIPEAGYRAIDLGFVNPEKLEVSNA